MESLLVEKNNNIKACYIHIPFCKNICSYCDFCKNYYNEKITGKYLKALEKEIKEKYKKDVLQTLYVGGGTPSALSIKELNNLFKILNIFNLDSNYEFTFECNYEDINEEFLSTLKKNKVNRLSIGIQTFNEEYSNILNRRINKKEIIKSINLSKKYFSNINIDIIYALPYQKMTDLKRDLKEFLKLDVSHISTYALIKERHTKLYIDDIKELDDDTQNKMYYYIISYLKENGYNHYEISNFSKKGYESKHNLVYWNNKNYYGFGLGASGFIRNVRYTNTKSINNYISCSTVIHKEILSKKDLIMDEVMLNLRKTTGINKDDFYNKYKISFDEIFDYKNLVLDKLLCDDGNNVFIPTNKLFISNEIIIRLLDKNTLE